MGTQPDQRLVTDPDAAHPRFEKISEELVFEGAVVRCFRARFRGPDGAEFERDVVKHPGAVSVVAVEGAEVILVRQYRAALGTDLLEIVAGKRDVAGEDPVLTAARELAEEVGYVAARFDPLIDLAQSPGFCDEINHLYLATDLTPTERDLQGIEEQHMTVERLPLSEIRTAIADGRIIDAKSVVGLLLALDRLDATT